MSRGTDRPKRALLSLKSMGVMCVVLAVLAWANTIDIPCDGDIQSVGGAMQPILRIDFKYCRRGLPWAYRTNTYVIIEREAIDASGNLVKTVDPPAESSGPEPFDLTPHGLLLDLAFAYAVSIALALASERFVFSKMRRGREGEKAPS